MPRKEIAQVNLAAANPNLSPAALIFPSRSRCAIERVVEIILETGRASLDHTAPATEKKRLPTCEHSIRLQTIARAFN